MSLLHREWEMLLVLAQRYGWDPERGNIDRYAEGGRVSREDAASMAAAIERALPDVPTFVADGLTEEQRRKPQPLTELRARRPGNEQGDPLAYFSGRGRVALTRFVHCMGPGAVEVSLMPGISAQF